MSTLTEIEAAADRLRPEEQQELLMFLAARLRANRGALPLPRDIPVDQINQWIAEDEQDMKRFSEGR